MFSRNRPATVDNGSRLDSALPPEILRFIGPFLAGSDLARLSQTCRNIHQSFSLSFVTVRLLDHGHWMGGYQDGDTPRILKKIPFFVRKQLVHTMLIRGRYNDQGWGNRKSYLSVAPCDKDTTPEELKDCVASTPLAEHHSMSFCMEFQPTGDENTDYNLWYAAGGGGGHELFVNDLTASFLIWDTPNRYLSKNYTKLEEQDGALDSEFGLSSLKTMATCTQCMLAQAAGQAEETLAVSKELMTLWESLGIDANEESMRAILELALNGLPTSQTMDIDEGARSSALEARAHVLGQGIPGVRIFGVNLARRPHTLRRGRQGPRGGQR